MFIQKVFNPVSSLLVNKRYKNIQSPYKAFDLIEKNVTLPNPTKGSILIGPIRMSGVAHAFEGVLGYSLRMRGYKVYALMCGQALDVCESKDLKFSSNIKCSGCFKEQKMFCETYGIEPIYINSVLSSKEKDDINLALKNMSIDNMKNPNGIDLIGEITSGLMRVLKSSDVKKNEFLPLLKKYGKTAMLTYQATENIFKKLKINQVVMSHGVYSTWGAMIRATEDANIKTVVWGRGYVGTGNIMAAHGKSYLHYNIIEPLSNYINHELTQEERQLTLEYIKNKRNPKSKVDYVSYYNKDKNITKSIDIHKELNIPKGVKIFGMFPNIPWDGQLFSSSEFYPNINQFVKSTIEWFIQNPEHYLVIRAHPAELSSISGNQLETFATILNKSFPILPKNVIFLEAGSHLSSYQIAEHIEAALLYAGTISLEFATNKKIVIQTGKNFSSNKGFVFEPKNDKEYYHLLESIVNGKTTFTDEMYEKALKFIYHWIFKRHIPETAIKLKGQLIFDGYYFNSTQELKDNKEISWFIDKMETLEDFVYDL